MRTPAITKEASHVVTVRPFAPVSPGSLTAEEARERAASILLFRRRHDASTVRKLFEKHPELRERINSPLFAFDSPAIVACADDLAMVDVLLDFGADPNRRSDWWAGGFHPLHSATGAAAERLMAAGAIPDACAAAHLDRPDLLGQLIADNPALTLTRETWTIAQSPTRRGRARRKPLPRYCVTVTLSLSSRSGTRITPPPRSAGAVTVLNSVTPATITRAQHDCFSKRARDRDLIPPRRPRRSRQTSSPGRLVTVIPALS